MGFPIPDRELLRLTTAGSVDDGKSTLMGRLLHDCSKVYEDQLEAARQTSLRKGNAEVDLSLLMDGLSAEREQGITIDVAYRYFTTPKRRFIIADVPGHEQYTRNMVTGASNAHLAVILVDITKGFLFQAKRHLVVATLLQTPHLLIAINKMDLVGYDEGVYEKIKGEISQFVSKLGVRDLQFIPVSSLKGDMVVKQHDQMNWYGGYTLLRYLENLHISSDRNLIDFRFPVQLVIRPDASFRGYAGRIEGGVIHIGDDIVSLPSGKKSRISSILTPEGEKTYAFTPQSVTLVLEDEIDASRGDMFVRPENIPDISHEFQAAVFWMSESPLIEKKSYLIKQGTKITRGYVSELRYRIDMDDLHRKEAKELAGNDVGRAFIKTHEPLMFDPYSKNRNTGCFIFIDELTYETAGVGIIWHRFAKSDHLQYQEFKS